MKVNFEGKSYNFPDDVTDQEITTFLSGSNAPPPPKAQAEPAPSISLGEITVGEDYVGSKKVARAGIETLGSIGGGAAGSFLGPAGTVAGEIAGYAGSSKAADYLFGEDTGSFGRKLGEGALFSTIPRGLLWGAEKVSRGLVRSALKIPPTQVNEKTAKNAVDTVIKENMRVGEGGVSKGKEIIESSEQYLNNLLANSKESVDATKFVDAITALRKDPRFRFSSDPGASDAIFEEVALKALTHPEVSASGKIPLFEAQQLKKGLYRELDKFYKNFRSLDPSKAITTDAELVGKASWASDIRKQILESPGIPKDAAEVLARESNIVNTLGWIRRRVNVAAGMDPLTFNDVIVGGLIREGWPAALAVRFLRLPAVQSQVGIWLSKPASLRQPLQAGAIATKGLLSQ